MRTLIALILGCWLPLVHAAGPLTVLNPREPAPAFTLPDIQGQTHRLADYRGKVLMVNFWATWCPPCREEMPSLQRAWKALQADGVELVAIDFAEPLEEVVAFQAEAGIEFALLLDNTGAEVRRWPMRGLPTTFVLDRTGQIALKVQGERDWDDPALLTLLRALAAER